MKRYNGRGNYIVSYEVKTVIYEDLRADNRKEAIQRAKKNIKERMEEEGIDIKSLKAKEVVSEFDTIAQKKKSGCFTSIFLEIMKGNGEK